LIQAYLKIRTECFRVKTTLNCGELAEKFQLRPLYTSAGGGDIKKSKNRKIEKWDSLEGQLKTVSPEQLPDGPQ
jgi:hypothetical protein